MTAYLLADHLLNLLAPAALMALLLAVFSRLFQKFFKPKQPLAQAWYAQAAINFIVGAVVLTAGLALLGRDGKMLTYVLLVLAMALGQWWQLGGWKPDGKLPKASKTTKIMKPVKAAKPVKTAKPPVS
ncbi:MAG: hypothetical protein JWR60_153 [Polaromonas sp.]|nr:hypothetical protein [Polaromonas sp.]